MDTGSIAMLIALVCLVILSAYFSATETAFSSLNTVRLKTLSEHSKRAKLALKLSGDYDRLLSTILIGNNIANISMASIGTVLFVKHFGDIGATLSTVVITIVVLIFGEISPKSLAKESPEAFAIFSAPILRVLILILTPVNFLFSLWKKLLSKLFKVKKQRGITDEELLTFVSEAEQEGGINKNEGELIRSAIEFKDLEAIDIYTPRVDVAAISVDESPEDIIQLFLDTGFSRLPVYEGSIDNIIGMIHHKDFFNSVLRNGMELKSILKPVVYIVPTIKISKLLALLQQSKTHIAVIIDEFGGTVGIVTLEDILEELVGDIYDEYDKVSEDIQKLSDSEYLVAGATDLDDFCDLFHLSPETDANTVGGWVVEELGKIPSPGDVLTYANITITVTKTDEQRLLQMQVDVLPHSTTEKE